MGNCMYCHAKAGLFRTEHSVCAKEAESAREYLHQVVSEAITGGKSPGDIQADISMIRREGRLTDDVVKAVMLQAVDASVREVAQGRPVDDEDFERIASYYTSADPTWESRNATERVTWSGYLSLMHSSTLHQVLHHQVPYTHPGAYDGFRFQKDEYPIVQRYATLAEYRSVQAGRSFQSVGMPIGGGLYYRVGISQPRTSQTGLVPVDDGLMVITSQAIIYSGQQRNFRLPYSSILRMESFVDGFGVHENYGSGMVFIPSKLGAMDEGWYFSNIVSALMKW